MYSLRIFLEQGRLQGGSGSSCRGQSPLETSQPVFETLLLPAPSLRAEELPSAVPTPWYLQRKSGP